MTLPCVGLVLPLHWAEGLARSNLHTLLLLLPQPTSGPKKHDCLGCNHNLLPVLQQWESLGWILGHLEGQMNVAGDAHREPQIEQYFEHAETECRCAMCIWLRPAKKVLIFL